MTTVREIPAAHLAPRRRSLALARPATLPVALGAVGFLALVALSLYLRTRSIHVAYWLDEGLSVGIASHHLTAIPGVLRLDGSPPLYYLLLHLWMGVFGSGEVSTHALSLLFALLAVPAALWAGWSLFGQRAGWICAVLTATNPFLTAYAQETRMYSLVILLGILATAAFAHAFVFGRRRYVPVFAVLLALLLYTHNWAVFFTLGAIAALLVCAWMGPRPRREVLRDGLLGFGGAALLFLPWVPTLLYQALHTGAPWSARSTYRAAAQIPHVLLRSGSVEVALLLGAVPALVALLRRPRGAERAAVLSVLVLLVGAMVSAYAASKVSPGWASRYFAMFLGPLLVLAAAGLSRARATGLLAVAVVLLLWAQPQPASTYFKSNAKQVAARVDPKLRPGDVVVSTHPEQIALLDHYFRPGLRYATSLGPAPDPRVMDWRNALARLRAAQPPALLDRLLARLPVGGRLLLVRPIFTPAERTLSVWTGLVSRRSAEWHRAVAGDPRLVRLPVATGYRKPTWRAGVRVDLYVKQRTKGG